MQQKFIDISEATSIPVPRDVTPQEEAEILAQYKSHRTLESLEADYKDFEKQIAEAIPAEQLLKELQQESTAE